MKTIYDLVTSAKSDTYFPLTVGSLPAFSTTGRSSSTRSKPKASAVEAIEMQAKYGVHFPSTGESTSINSDGMDTGFLQAFEGVKSVDGEFVVVGELSIKQDALRTLEVVKDVEQAKTAIDRLMSTGDYPEFVALKATLSGPGFLAQRVEIETNLSMQSLMSRFAEGLAEIAFQMYEAGARVIQIDEPLFTSGHKYRRETGQALQSLFSQLRLRLPEVKFLALHACKVHSVDSLAILDKLDVDVLDLEFTEHPEHFSLFTNQWLLRSEKNIGVGVVSGGTNFVETDTELIQHITQIFNNYDPDLVILKPDCQLRLVPPEVAIRKLEQLNFARQKALELLKSAT